MSVDQESSQKIHLIGIGGSGMSGLARLLIEKGYRISGSDLREAHDLVESTEGKIEFFRGHATTNVHARSRVVFSSAIAQDHLELVEARRLNIPIVHRSQVLGEIMAEKKSIAVTGMHGKTSTTGWISKILIDAGRDPAVFAGDKFVFLNGNARWGQGDCAVFEADESDGSLLNYQPEAAVITNLEPEHLNYFRDFNHILDHFEAFIRRVREKVFLCWDDPGCRALARRFPREKFMTYGLSDGAELQAYDLKTKPWSSSFRVKKGDEDLGEFKLNVPGHHQVLNSLAAVGVGLHLGISSAVIKESLLSFTGAQRRFEVRGRRHGVTFVDDYAHHPTEIRATIKAARTCFSGKILVVFQPHRYSRTLHLKEGFAQAFQDADHVIVTDIYASDETPIPGVSGQLIHDEILRYGKPTAEFISHIDEIKNYLKNHYLEYEAVLTLGAGDITRIHEGLMADLDEEIPGWGKLKGKVMKKELMARHTTFHIGGPVDIWVEPADIEDLVCLQKWARSKGVPLFVIGNGSNVIVRDGGIRGVVVRLSHPSFKEIHIEGDFVTAGAGVSLSELIAMTMEAGLSGLENLKGIPGTVGGALHMNAGAYGSDIAQRMVSVVALSADGTLETLASSKLSFQYRSSPGLSGRIVIQARFKLELSQSRLVQQRIVQLKTERAERYPKLPNAGCIFKNPKEDFAGKLIDELGLKNLTVGGAQVSGQHGNFIVNTGHASAKDVLDLIEKIRGKVYEQKKVILENEVEVIGED